MVVSRRARFKEWRARQRNALSIQQGQFNIGSTSGGQGGVLRYGFSF